MDKYEYLWTCVRNNMLPGDISGCMSQNASSNNTYIYEEIFLMSINDMVNKLNITKKQAEYIMSTKAKVDPDKEYENFKRSGARAVTMLDKDYPKRLRYIDNPPYALFYYGSLPDEDTKSVAIIGARKCSEYGRHMAENIAAGLAKEKVNIISGMAYGIDGIAQMEAMNKGGKSYAVIGSGVDICYPRANKAIYDRLKHAGGIISEYPIGAAAASTNFPMRNRIISGLSDVVIVVEAGLKSGTLITVDQALLQGKEIMVVPGRVTDPLSVGCNALLFQGAYPVQSSDDVMRLLDTLNPSRVGNYMSDTKTTFRTKELKNYIPKESDEMLLDENEKVVFESMDYYPMDVEKIAEKSGMNLLELMNTLICLEMKNMVCEKGKNAYVKCV